MTKEQALKDMQERCRICKRDALPSEKECENCYFPIAIESIKKQVPMRVATNKGKKRCPKCRMPLTYEKYCCDCGQAIEWSEEDD